MGEAEVIHHRPSLNTYNLTLINDYSLDYHCHDSWLLYFTIFNLVVCYSQERQQGRTHWRQQSTMVHRRYRYDRRTHLGRYIYLGARHGDW